MIQFDNEEYSWLSKSINDINRSYFLFKLRNEAVNSNGTKAEDNKIMELVDAQHKLIQKIEDYIQKPIKAHHHRNASAALIEKPSSILLMKTYALSNQNYSFGKNDNDNDEGHKQKSSSPIPIMLKQHPSSSSAKLIKMRKRQLSSGCEVNAYLNKKMSNANSLSKPKLNKATYTGKERLKRANNINLFPFRAITQYIKDKEKLHK